VSEEGVVGGGMNKEEKKKKKGKKKREKGKRRGGRETQKGQYLLVYFGLVANQLRVHFSVQLNSMRRRTCFPLSGENEN
jgi:hypothetical protein